MGTFFSGDEMPEVKKQKKRKAFKMKKKVGSGIYLILWNSEFLIRATVSTLIWLGESLKAE